MAGTIGTTNISQAKRSKVNRFKQTVLLLHPMAKRAAFAAVGQPARVCLQRCTAALTVGHVPILPHMDNLTELAHFGRVVTHGVGCELPGARTDRQGAGALDCAQLLQRNFARLVTPHAFNGRQHRVIDIDTGTPPSATPSRARRACGPSDLEHGVLSLAKLMVPTIDFSKSASSSPVARKKAR